MKSSPTLVPRAAILARTLARGALVLAAIEIAFALYTVLFGGFRVYIGPVAIAAAVWWRPFDHAALIALAAALLFHRDARLRGHWDVVPRAILAYLSAPPDEVRRRLGWWAVIAGSAVSLLVSYRLARQSITLGTGGEGGWFYPFIAPIALAPFAVWAVASALVVAAVRWLPLPRGRAWPIVLAWIAVGLGVQALLRSLTPFTLGQMIASGVANSFYSVAQAHDAASVLRDFAQLRSDWPIHAHSNMPGKLMLTYALELISARPAVLGWLFVGFSSLGSGLMYVFVRDLIRDRRVALFAAILYMCVPGKLFFLPLMNTATPVVALAVAVVVQRWMMTWRASYAAAAGVALFVIPFFEPLPLVMGLLFAMLAARALSRGEITVRRFALQCLVLVSGFAIAYMGVRASIGFDLFDAFRRVGTDAVAFNAAAGREYRVWVQQNPTDFFFGVGVCQTLVFAFAFADALWSGAVRRVFEPVAVLTIALAGMLLTLDLAGLNRGEVLRLWIFLECLFQIPTAYLCVRLNSRWAFALVLVTTLLQGALGAATVGFVIP